MGKQITEFMTQTTTSSRNIKLKHFLNSPQRSKYISYAQKEAHTKHMRITKFLTRKENLNKNLSIKLKRKIKYLNK